MIYTVNFHPDTDPKILCTCGHPDCDRRSITQNTLNALQLIREEYGKPMVITSGGRCPNHPDQVGKDDPNGGDHPSGHGVDIAVDNRKDFNRLAMLAGRYGFNAIGDGLARGFIHLGVREQTRVSSWGY